MLVNKKRHSKWWFSNPIIIAGAAQQFVSAQMLSPDIFISVINSIHRLLRFTRNDDDVKYTHKKPVMPLFI